jgi:RecB family endonuclease NucS
LIYKIVTGKNAKQLRELNNIPDGESVRGVLSAQEIKEVVKYERIVESLLELGKDYEEIKGILTDPNILKASS